MDSRTRVKLAPVHTYTLHPPLAFRKDFIRRIDSAHSFLWKVSAACQGPDSYSDLSQSEEETKITLTKRNPSRTLYFAVLLSHTLHLFS